MGPEHKLPRIAVIAVHGVADQKPGETARIAADLLSRAEGARSEVERREALGAESEEDARAVVETSRYEAFQEADLRIPVKPVLGRELPAYTGAAISAPLPAPRRFGLAFQQQSFTAASRIEGTAPPDAEISRVSYEYMEEQLRGHVLDEKDAIFETIRLESVRTGSKTRVDVFELYWADLSRFVGNWLRWIIEFYQLLFFLCLLGRKSLDFARAAYERRARTSQHDLWPAWPAFGWCQLVAEQALVLFVPVLNIYLLGIASCILPLLLPVRWIPGAITVFLALVASIGVGVCIYRRRREAAPGGSGWPPWVLAPMVIFPIAALVVVAAIALSHPYLWLEGVWWVVLLAAITCFMAAFQKSRPGALLAGLIAGLLTTAFFIGELIWGHALGPRSIMPAILRTAEWTMSLLELTWLVVLAAAIGATVAGFLAPRAVVAPPAELEVEQGRARRAAWTANLTLVLPALTVIILNVTLWQALLHLTVPKRPVPVAAATSPGERLLSPLARVKRSPLWNVSHTPIPAWARGFELNSEQVKADPNRNKAWWIAWKLMEQSYTPFYWLFCGFFAIAALLLVWSILPAVVAELRLDEQKNQTSVERQEASSWLGESLSAGFLAMRVSGEIIRWTCLCVLPFAILAGCVAPWLHFGTWMATANHWFLLVGTWLIVALIAAKGPFKPIALGLRSALDVALDVINWLRLFPLDSNPRARICARFKSLLRHVEEWEDPRDGSRFDAIVILAHSQGTVITADLLHFLNDPKNPQLAPKLPIYLFTMGNPLRQLYSLRFPHLYSWARHSDPTWAGDRPMPAEIGVRRWVNAYRSGDYVGRYIWHPDAAPQQNPAWSTTQVHVDGPRGKREFCIGSGAHTHYWDETAPEIAVELDRLVGLAAALALPKPAPAAAPVPPKVPSPKPVSGKVSKAKVAPPKAAAPKNPAPKPAAAKPAVPKAEIPVTEVAPAPTPAPASVPVPEKKKLPAFLQPPPRRQK